MKYGDPAVAERYSHAPYYPEANFAAVKEMHREVGNLETGKDGVARRGLLVRHLVLPSGLAGTERIVEFLAEEISKDTYANIMDQYRPCYRAQHVPPLNRRITAREFTDAIRLAKQAGLHRFDKPEPRIPFAPW